MPIDLKLEAAESKLVLPDFSRAVSLTSDFESMTVQLTSLLSEPHRSNMGDNP